jgi:hypothetical protein
VVHRAGDAEYQDQRRRLRVALADEVGEAFRGIADTLRDVVTT